MARLMQKLTTFKIHITMAIVLLMEQSPVIEIYEWDAISPSGFKKYILKEGYRKKGQTPTGIYNTIMKKTEENLDLAVWAAETAAEIFAKKKFKSETLLFLELATRCHFMLRNLSGAVNALARITKLNLARAKSTALELAHMMANHAEDFGASDDHRPKVFREVCKIFHHYNEREAIARLHIRSASIYSQHGATQAAYRNLADAERISVELGLPLLKAECYETATAVACRDNDLKDAIKFGRLSLFIYRRLNKRISAALYSNIGMAYMNRNRPRVAANYFELALKAGDVDKSTKASVIINLVDCFRRLGELTRSQKMIEDAREVIGTEHLPEESLELSISAAKLAAAQSNIAGVIENLRMASACMDEVLKTILRLHHRREIRARHFVRIEKLLSNLPLHGNGEDALLPLLAIRGNAMADWIAIMSWADEVKSKVSDSIAGKIDKILRRIREIGAPHLFGFQEKYDDAWEVKNPVAAWDDFSQICREIQALGFEPPLKNVNTQEQLKLCRRRLSESHCLAFTTTFENKTLVWFFIREKYWRIEISDDEIDKWHLAQLKYATDLSNRRDFTAEIDVALRHTFEPLTMLFENVAKSNCQSIRYVIDSRIDLPLTQFALNNSELSAKMQVGEFHVRTVPSLSACSEYGGSIISTAAISDPGDDLLLAGYEGSAFASIAGLQFTGNIAAGSDDNLSELIGAVDAVVVSTHGQTIELLTDATFGKLGTQEERHLISVDELQRSAPDFNAKLVILNACHSGSKSSRNYHKRFITSDSVTIPSLFLLNRQAISIGSAWKISDTASFILSCLVAESLRNGSAPLSAAARAIGQLPRMSLTDVLSFLKNNLPEPVYHKVSDRLFAAPKQGMFLHPYFTAGLAIYGLL